MVVCRFFLQGTCRFGENCKFEHQVNDQHRSIIRQQNFNSNSNPGNIDTNTLIRAVINDMQIAEKGGQWLLSCYAPFKEKPNFPGFNEQSFEEVRWGYMEAQKELSVSQYCQQLQMALQQAISKIRTLQNPTPDIVNTIKSIYNHPPSGSSNVFGNSNTNPFGNSQNSVFGNPAAVTSNTNVFGQSSFENTPNVFGQNSQQSPPQTQSIFATANQKIFGNPQQQQTGSVFGNAMPGQQSGSVFSGAQPVQQSGSVFSGAQPVQQSGSVFSNPQQTIFGETSSNQNIFANAVQNSSFATPTSPFGNHQKQEAFAPQQAVSPFGPQAQNNFGFQQQQSGTSVFANSPFSSNNQQPFVSSPQQQQNVPFKVNNQQPTPFNNQTNFATTNNQTSIFANTQESQISSSNSMFGSTNATVIASNPSNQINESVYSKLEDLSENDIKSFESENFEFGKIPEKPPTIQMCF